MPCVHIFFIPQHGFLIALLHSLENVSNCCIKYSAIHAILLSTMHQFDILQPHWLIKNTLSVLSQVTTDMQL